jgi:WD40 repeat protein
VEVWDLATGERKGEYDGHAGLVRSLAFRPDGKWLASGGDDQCVILWNIERDKPMRRIEGLGDDVRAVVFSPDNKRLAAAGAYVQTWAIADLLVPSKK